MKKKSLLICYTGSKGGGAQYAYYIAKNIIGYFDEVDVIISSQNEMLDLWRQLPVRDLYELNTYSNKREFILNTTKLLTFQKNNVKKHFKNRTYTAVYVPMTGLWTGTIVDCINYSQLVVTLHDPIDHTSYSNIISTLGLKITHRLLKYDIISKSDKIIILSKHFIPELKKRKLPKCKKIAVIPHGNNIEVVQKNNQGIKNNNTIEFLFFGRIDKYKGIGILAKSYEIMRNKHNNISLTIAGSGDINQTGIDFSKLSDVHLENRWIKDEEIQSFFDRDHTVITVLPYIDATQSGVIPIAQAVGSLVLCSNVGGLPEQVDDGKSGVLFKANSVKDLTTVMENVIQNYSSYLPIIKNAKSKADENSWESIAKKVAETILKN